MSNDSSSSNENRPETLSPTELVADAAPAVDVAKAASMIVVLAKNASAVRSTVSFLERRGFAAKIVPSLNEAVELFSKKEANRLLLSANFAHPKVEMLPVLMHQSFQIETILFAEDSDRKSQSRLNNARTKHVLFGPVSGPVVMMKIRQIDRELEGADDSSSSGSARASTGAQDEGDIKVGGRKSTKDDTVVLNGRADMEKKSAFENMMKTLDETDTTGVESEKSGLARSGETYVQKGERAKLKGAQSGETSSSDGGGELSERARNMRTGLDLGLKEAPKGARAKLIQPNSFRRKPDADEPAFDALEAPSSATPEENRAKAKSEREQKKAQTAAERETEKAKQATDREEKARARDQERAAEKEADTLRAEQAKRDREQTQHEMAIRDAEKKKKADVDKAEASLGSSSAGPLAERADLPNREGISESPDGETVSDVQAQAKEEKAAREKSESATAKEKPEKKSKATSELLGAERNERAKEKEKANVPLGEKPAGSSGANVDHAAILSSEEVAATAAATAEAEIADEFESEDAAPPVADAKGIPLRISEMTADQKRALTPGEKVRLCLREALAIVAGSPVPNLLELNSYEHSALVSLRSSTLTCAFIVSLHQSKQSAAELFHRIQVAFFSLLRDHEIEFENHQTYAIHLDDKRIVRRAFEETEYSLISRSNEVEIGVAEVYTSDPVASIEPFDERMLSVKLRDLPVDVPVTFSLFLHMKRNQKFIRYLKKGSSITSGQVERLEKQSAQGLLEQTEVEAFKRHYAAHSIRAGKSRAS